MDAGSSDSSIANIGLSTVTRGGLRITTGSSAIGKSFQNLQWRTKRITSPSWATVTLKVYDSSDVLKAYGTGRDPNTVNTSFETLTELLNTPVTLAVGDRIVLEASGTGGGYLYATQAKSGTMPSGFEWTYYDGSWHEGISGVVQMYFDSTIP